eukprot:g51118.t1
MTRYVRLQRSTVALHTLDPNVLPEHGVLFKPQAKSLLSGSTHGNVRNIGVEFWVAEDATAQIEQLEQDVQANLVEAKAAGEEAKKALKRARAAEEEAKKAEERATAAEKQSVQLTRRLLELKGQLQEIGAAIVVPISGDENRQGVPEPMEEYTDEPPTPAPAPVVIRRSGRERELPEDLREVMQRLARKRRSQNRSAHQCRPDAVRGASEPDLRWKADDMPVCKF